MASRSPSKDISKLLAVVVGVVVVAALYFARDVFVPLSLGILFAFVLTPLVKLLERAHLGRVLSTFLVVVLALSLTGAIGWMLVKQFAFVLEQLPQYRSNLVEKVSALHVQNPALKNAVSTLDQLNSSLVAPADGPTDGSPGKGARAARPSRPLPVQVVEPPKLPLESLHSVIDSLLEVLIVIVFTIFMLLRRENFRNRFISLVGQNRLTAMTQALDEANDRVSRYLRTQLTVNAIYGALVGVGLYFIGIPGALLWGVIVGLLKFLPYVGPPLGAIMPVLLSLALFHGWKVPLLTLGLFVVIEATSSYMVEPLWYGIYTGVSPLALLVATIFWTFLWGPIGLVLSTPLTVCLVVVGRHIPHLGFLPLLFGDEPVLSPEIHIYQRLLATDQEEAEQVAEALLAKKSLSELYESVLAPVMSLVKQDRRQGQIDEPAARMVCQSMREIVDDLAEMNRKIDRKPPTGATPEAIAPSTPPHNILCIPARSFEEEIVALMLCQLLEESGQHAQTTPHGTAAEIARHMQSLTADTVCISVLAPGVISHARFLYRTVRAQFPRAEVIVALWGYTGDKGKVARRIGLGESEALVTTFAEIVDRTRGSQTVLPVELSPAPAS